MSNITICNAAYEGNIYFVRANIDKLSNDKYGLAMMEATYEGHIDIIILLLVHGKIS